MRPAGTRLPRGSMRDYLWRLSQAVRSAVDHWHGLGSKFGAGLRSQVTGDPQFGVDEVAERAVLDFAAAEKQPVALFTEAGGTQTIGRRPSHVIVVDPIDGSRGAAAGLECACISIAVAPYSQDSTLGDVCCALVAEWKRDGVLYADSASDAVVCSGYPGGASVLSQTDDLSRMFWSCEFNGHPAQLMVSAYGHLIDLSANTGGLFVLNSASFSLSRIVTGQLDAYLDIGNRLLRDHPDLEPQFRGVGGGHVLHLFPYDIAASVYIAKKAGATVSDAYGQPLDNTLLLDCDQSNQQSCVAAANHRLHARLLEAIVWP